MSIGPVYGAPLGALPPGSTWRSVRDMLSEAFSNLHREWVQDFLFRPDPKVQVQLLTSPDNLSHSMGFTQRIYSDPGTVPPEFEFDKLMVALVVPACMEEGLIAAVMVDSHTSSEIIVNRTDRVVQAIGDPAGGSNLTVSIDETNGTVEMWYDRTSFGNGSERMYTMSVFRFSELMKAIRPGYVDLDAVERSIIKSLIGTQPPAQVQSSQVTTTEAGQVDAVGEGFPGRDNVDSGDWYSQSMLGMYSDNGTLTFSMPYGLIMSRSYGVAAHAFQQMKSWGIRDRLGRLKISIPFEIPYHSNHGSPDISQQRYASSSSPDIQSQCTNIGISHRSSAPQLAPAPPPREHQAGDASPPMELSYAEKADLEYKAKLERKRQRNRIAAARSNQKRSAERKKRRAAGMMAVSQGLKPVETDALTPIEIDDIKESE